MAKSTEAKAAVHSTTTVDQEVRAYHARAAALALPPAGDSFDPQETIVRGLATVEQLTAAKAKHETPSLLLYFGNPQVTWSAIFHALIDETTTAINKPGGRTMPTEPPKTSPIDLAIANAERVRRRLQVAAEPSPWEADKNDSMKLQLFGDRKAPTGKVRWEADLDASITAIEELGAAATPTVQAMLPLLNGALAQLKQALPLPAGRSSPAPIYSEPAIRAALALDLAVGDLRRWAASQANDARYGSILRAIAPKRTSDARPAAGAGAQAGAAPGEAGGAPAGAAEGAALVAKEKDQIRGKSESASA